MSRRRRSIRLRGYDYSLPGAYFTIIRAQDRTCILGEVVSDEVRLTDAGHMVAEVWQGLPDRFHGIDLDAFIVMPNHVHGIIVMVGAGLVPARDAGVVRVGDARATTRVAPTVGDVVGAFKSLTTVHYIRGVRGQGWPRVRDRLWQRNCYEHIIRSPESLDRLRRNVFDNPRRWWRDPENPAGLRFGPT